MIFYLAISAYSWHDANTSLPIHKEIRILHILALLVKDQER